MWVTEVLPWTGERADATTADGRSWLTEKYEPGGESWIRLNMITSLTGSAVGSDGTSDTLTNRADRAILGVIRSTADAVVVGAQTVRAEGYLLPRRSRLVIVSSSGDLAGHRLEPDANGPDDQVILVLPDGAAAPPPVHGVSLLRVGSEGPRMPLPAVLSALGDRGIRRIVCEGGPRLAAQFAAHDVVDEYCVTTAPRLVPSAGPFLPIRRQVPTRAAGMLVDEDGFSYLRLRRS